MFVWQLRVIQMDALNVFLVGHSSVSFLYESDIIAVNPGGHNFSLFVSAHGKNPAGGWELACTSLAR